MISAADGEFDRAAHTTGEGRAHQRGRGAVAVAQVAGAAAITRLLATSPLKLLAPRRRQRAAWVYASSYGGGLVAGDRVDLEVEVGPGAALMLGTQASTKVYRCPGDAVAEQRLEAEVAPGGLLVSAPDPVVCFAGAAYEQRQRFALRGDAGLVMVDGLTSGRMARGERWQLTRYTSRTEVTIDGRLAFVDALALDPAADALLAPHVAGRFQCIALAVLAGAPLADAAEALVQRVGGLGVTRRAALLLAASRFDGGAVLRIAGEETETVQCALQQELAFAADLLGDAPWARKW